MKLIGVKERLSKEEVYYYLEVETKEELNMYFEKFQDEFKAFFKSLITSNYAPKKWDHVQVKGTPAALFYSAVVRMGLTDRTPYESIDDMSALKVQVFNSSFDRYGSLCINLEMGTCRPPFTDDEIDLIVSNEKIESFDLKKDDYQNL